MNPAATLIVAMFGIAACACAAGGVVLIAEARAKAASRKWWQNRDPEWRDPISDGAPAANAGSSAATSLARVGNPVSAASHPTACPPKVDSEPTNRTPSEFISSLVAGGSLRRVA